MFSIIIIIIIIIMRIYLRIIIIIITFVALNCAFILRNGLFVGIKYYNIE